MTKKKKGAELPGTSAGPPANPSEPEGRPPRQAPANPHWAPREFLLTTRATVILLLALIVGGAVGFLTWSNGHDLSQTILAALGATGGAIPVLHTLVGP